MRPVDTLTQTRLTRRASQRTLDPGYQVYLMKKSRGSRLSSVELFTVTFRNIDDVVKFDESCEVPRHIDGRQSLDTERWILGRYLRALATAGSLAYPLTATHAKQSESPDFTLSMPGGVQIGLEATEASTPEAHLRYMSW
jgi:hypothetical protein